MILQFKVKNFLSFKDQAILDMTAIPAYKEHGYNLMQLENDEKVNKVAPIYGANASGKSNLILAIDYFINIIIKSMNNAGENEERVLVEYSFPYFSAKEATEFEIVMIFEGNEYRYGYEYNQEHIVSEWLYRKNLLTNRNVVIFERELDKINLGPAIRKECDKYKSQIPQEALVLTFFSRLSLETTVFQNVYQAIKSNFVTYSDTVENKRFILASLPSMINEKKLELKKFIQAIDTGIKDIFYEEEGEKIKFYSVHMDKEGNRHAINLYNESEGTLKAIALFIVAQNVIARNGILWMDELNAKLHPLLSKFIVDMFQKKEINAQLIYTTHDTTLLDKKFFRRDQIWFVQKDEFGCSQLFALSDYKVRSDASFEKDYLAGVYGGIPFLKDL